MSEPAPPLIDKPAAPRNPFLHHPPDSPREQGSVQVVAPLPAEWQVIQDAFHRGLHVMEQTNRLDAERDRLETETQRHLAERQASVEAGRIAMQHDLARRGMMLAFVAFCLLSALVAFAMFTGEAERMIPGFWNVVQIGIGAVGGFMARGQLRGHTDPPKAP